MTTLFDAGEQRLDERLGAALEPMLTALHWWPVDNSTGQPTLTPRRDGRHWCMRRDRLFLRLWRPNEYTVKGGRPDELFLSLDQSMPVGPSECLLHARIRSVDQALAYLRVAGVLPGESGTPSVELLVKPWEAS